MTRQHPINYSFILGRINIKSILYIRFEIYVFNRLQIELPKSEIGVSAKDAAAEYDDIDNTSEKFDDDPT